MKGYKKGGLKLKYEIRKTNGSPVDPKADYFVLRLDKDPHALRALAAYAESVAADNLEFAHDLKQKLGGYGFEELPPQQNTLNRDKVKEVMQDKVFWAFNAGGNWDLYKQDVADAICSLAIPGSH